MEEDLEYDNIVNGCLTPQREEPELEPQQNDLGLTFRSSGTPRNQILEEALDVKIKMLINMGANKIPAEAENTLESKFWPEYRKRIEKDKVKKAIVLEIDTAYERLVSYKKALRTARKAVELAEERLNQEQELWQKGVGDVYRLVEQQQMLGNTKIRTVEAEGALSKSVISLWISSGQVFQQLGIDRNLIGNE